MMGRYAGAIGEKIAQKLLVDAGYELKSFDELASDVLSKDETPFQMVRRSSAELFLGEKYQDFIKFCEAWNTDPDVPSTIRSHQSYIQARAGQVNPIVEPPTTGLDWVGRKDAKFYLIEVKTNRASLQNYQQKMLLKSKEFGFTPLVLRIKVKISFPQEEIAWKFI